MSVWFRLVSAHQLPSTLFAGLALRLWKIAALSCLLARDMVYLGGVTQMRCAGLKEWMKKDGQVVLVYNLVFVTDDA
jgi:hypothetical protein